MHRFMYVCLSEEYVLINEWESLQIVMIDSIITNSTLARDFNEKSSMPAFEQAVSRWIAMSYLLVSSHQNNIRLSH